MDCHQSATNIWGCSIPAQANFSTARLETLRPASTTSYISSPFAVHVSDHLSDLHEPHEVIGRMASRLLHELNEGAYPRSCTLRILEYYTACGEGTSALHTTHLGFLHPSTTYRYISLMSERLSRISRQTPSQIYTCHRRFHRSTTQTEQTTSWNDQARHLPRCSKK